MSEQSILHEHDPMFHTSSGVELARDFAQQNGNRIPNDPREKIANYLGFLADSEYANDGILTGDSESLDRQVEHHIVQLEDVPETYFNQIRRAMRDEGHGNLHLTHQMKVALVGDLQSGQRLSLREWARYLGTNDAGYSDDFRTYVWNSVVRLKPYDPHKNTFPKRSKGTVAPYPVFNAEALANVDEMLWSGNGRNFGKLYADAFRNLGSIDETLLQTTEGSWVRYPMSSSHADAQRLSHSLASGTGWCIANTYYAASYLARGDFYVYYTAGKDGVSTVPRAAIATTPTSIIEMRGILPGQSLEPQIASIAMDKAGELPGGERYAQLREDMQHLARIDHLTEKDPLAPLSSQDVRFLYELDRKISSVTGYRSDGRIEEIKNRRVWVDDMAVAYRMPKDDRLLFAMLGMVDKLAHGEYQDYYERRKADSLYESLLENVAEGKFEGLNIEVADVLMTNGYGSLVLKAPEQFGVKDFRRFIEWQIRSEGPDELIKQSSYLSDENARIMAQVFVEAGKGALIMNRTNSRQSLLRSSVMSAEITRQSRNIKQNAFEQGRSHEAQQAIQKLLTMLARHEKVTNLVIPDKSEAVHIQNDLIRFCERVGARVTFITPDTKRDKEIRQITKEAERQSYHYGTQGKVRRDWHFGDVVIVDRTDLKGGHELLKNLQDADNKALVIGVGTKEYTPRVIRPAHERPVKNLSEPRIPAALRRLQEADRSKLSPTRLARMFEDVLKSESMPPEPKSDLIEPYSIEEIVKHDVEDVLLPIAVDPLQMVAHSLLSEQLDAVLDTLSERQAGVVSMRFGLTDGDPKTLDEIGAVYGVTRERVRQLESKTMSSLRHPSRSQVLRDYLDD